MTKNDYINAVDKIEPSAEFYEKAERRMREAQRAKTKSVNGVMALKWATAACALVVAVTCATLAMSNRYKFTAMNDKAAVYDDACSLEAGNEENSVAEDVKEETAVETTAGHTASGYSGGPVKGGDGEKNAPATTEAVKKDEGVEDESDEITPVEDAPETTTVAVTAVPETTTEVVANPCSNDDEVTGGIATTSVYTPIEAEIIVKDGKVYILITNKSGRLITTGLDYELYSFGDENRERIEVAVDDLAAEVPDGKTLEIPIYAELKDGKYYVKKNFSGLDYTAECKFAVKDGKIVI